MLTDFWTTVKALLDGEQVGVVWIVFFAIGAFQFALLSIPSDGAYRVLVLLFLLSSGILTWTVFSRKKLFGGIGLLLMSFSAILRSFFLWDLYQNGAGSNYIASGAWSWISLLCLMVAGAVLFRGIEQKR